MESLGEGLTMVAIDNIVLTVVIDEIVIDNCY